MMMARLTQQQLETHLWGSANILRGRTAGQDFKTYILSLLFFKRLSDQYDYEADERVAKLERDRGGKPFTEAQRAALRASPDVHRFKIPAGCHWRDVRSVTQNVGEKLTAACREIAEVNGDDLRGVFTVQWNQPAPDGSGALLIANNVVLALIEHFSALPNGTPFDLSNRSVTPDVLGRAYEYLIKQFADDAGAKAGEFFTPPEVVDCLIRILEPAPGDSVYDPTCGSAGMLVHSADFLKERGHDAAQIRYFGQELNWQTFAIARINALLHGLEAKLVGGKSTITDPAFLDEAGGRVRRFSVVIANFPFSDEYWWLPAEQHGEEQAKLARKHFGKVGYSDKYARFAYGTPPAGTGDYAFVQHIVASLDNGGRAGIVCPQGVLFRGQPEVEEETGELDADGVPKVRRRKSDSEHDIRRGLLADGLVDAVIALPLNIFYGAGVPACLMILKKDRPAERRDKVLLVYAARHFRELSAMNQLRPQDVMRVLVHYHAYGDAARAGTLAAEHAARIKAQIEADENVTIARLMTEYQPHADKLEVLAQQQVPLRQQLDAAERKGDRAKLEKQLAQLDKQAGRPSAALAERDARIADARRRAGEDRVDVDATAAELVTLYADPAELARHARVVDRAEVEDNEFNLNIPRYVDTFEPEPPIDVGEALKALDAAEAERRGAEQTLRELLAGSYSRDR